MTTCGYTLPGWAFDLLRSKPCDLPEGHGDHHVSDTAEQGRIEWLQPDPSCDCDDCLGYSGDPMDACIAWSPERLSQ
jgi:hypothetical protein